MQPLHDKDLDRLSREAAELFEAESGASGWASLEKRLDVELPQKKKKRRFLFWLFFITATTGGALIGIMNKQPVAPLAKNTPGIVAVPSQRAANPGSAMPKAKSSTQTTTPSVAGNRQPAPAADVNITPESNTTVPVTQPGKTTTNNSTTNTQKTEKAKLSLNYAGITPYDAGNSTVSVSKNKKRTTGKQTTKRATNKIQEPTTQIADNDEPVNTSEPDQAAVQVPDVPAKKAELTAPVTTDSAAQTPAPSITKKEPEKKQDKKPRGIELGVMAGPDLSTVKFGPVYKTGYNFGVQLGYRFNNHWSVNTGVIYTKKFYKADSADFNYKSNWPNYKVHHVEGNCSMWEVPVNVRYDVSFNNKRRWFVSTGLSTYLMDKEDYTIYYTNGWNNNLYESTIKNDTNSNYLFSVLNLSAGMERSLGKHVSLQAEPYLKIPMKGMGMGSMRMTSYGILFTLKYRPQFNSKRSDTRK